MEERIDVMTDYQMRTLVNMIITIVEDAAKKEDAIEKLKAIRDGKLDEYQAAEKEKRRG